MRFLRHLAVVLLVVAAVVLLAVGWNHLAGGTLGVTRDGHAVPVVVPGQHGGAGWGRVTSPVPGCTESPVPGCTEW